MYITRFVQIAFVTRSNIFIGRLRTGVYNRKRVRTQRYSFTNRRGSRLLIQYCTLHTPALPIVYLREVS